MDWLLEQQESGDELPSLDVRPPRGSQDEADLVERVFRHYRSLGFPHTELKSLGGEFSKLRDTSSVLEGDTLNQSMLGLTIANSYHPEMMSVPCRNCRTSMDVFNDDALFRKALLHRIRYGSNLKPWGVRKSICSLSRTQTVSNFRPTVAQSVYRHFSPRLTVDFSAGWGGRLLGAMASGTPYVGIDPNKVSVENNRRMVSDLGELFQFPKPTLIETCAEDVLGRGLYNPDLIFTSPPYFDAERYSTDETQSYLRYPSLEGWYKGFLAPCIVGSFSDLTPNGHLVLNVNPNMADKVLELALDVGFHHVVTWKMALSQRQYNRKTCGLYRYEPVMVFRR
jgi:hypothetical protein